MGSYLCVAAAVVAGDVDVIDVADVIDAGGVGVAVDVAVAAVLAAVADVVVDANVSVLAARVHEMCATSAPLREMSIFRTKCQFFVCLTFFQNFHFSKLTNIRLQNSISSM